MAKAKKEFKNRVKKIQKHIEALRPLADEGPQQNVLDEIEEQLAFLRGDHPSQHEQRATDPRSIAG